MPARVSRTRPWRRRSRPAARGCEMENHRVGIARDLHRNGAFERSIRRSQTQITGIVAIVRAGGCGPDQGTRAEDRRAGECRVNGRAGFRWCCSGAESLTLTSFPKPSSREEDRGRKQDTGGQHPDAVRIVKDSGVLAKQPRRDFEYRSARASVVLSDAHLDAFAF
jgi:hypothetical protein